MIDSDVHPVGQPIVLAWKLKEKILSSDLFQTTVRSFDSPALWS